MQIKDFLLKPEKEFTENPFPYYQAIREHDPIWWSAEGRRWLITGYEQISALLKSDKAVVETVILDFEHDIEQARALRYSQRNWVSKVNEPDHSRLRKPFFEVSAGEQMERLAYFSGAEADRLLTAAEKKGSFDALFEYAAPLVTSVIAQWFDIPAESRVSFRRQIHLTASHFSPLIPDRVAPVYVAAEELLHTLRELAMLRRATASQARDFISLMVSTQETNVSLDELIDSLLLTVFASYETTLHLIGNGIYELINCGELLKEILAHPDNMSTAIDEILRLHGSVQLVTRRASETFDFQGKQFLKGQRLVLILAAGNRDPLIFDEPNSLKLGRNGRKHLAFGSGAHYCLGTYLAKQQTAIALLKLFQRFPEISPNGPLTFHPSPGIRGLLALPLKISK